MEDCSDSAQFELKASLDKSLEIIDRRQKLIRLADSSVYGWATVTEYEAPQLADDEDDDNKITRAENRAGRKIKQKKASAATAQEQKRFKFDGSGNAEAARGGNFRRSSPVPFYSTSLHQSKGGACFVCGSLAHWKATCPRKFNFNKPATTISATTSQ